MANLARSEPGIPVLPAQLERHPELLNVANGTIDLRSGTLHAAAREHLLTKQTPVTFDAPAVVPTWLAFLDRVS